MESAWIKPLLDMVDRTAASVGFGTAFIKASEEDRSRIRRGWNFGAEWKYPTPSRLACVKGEVGSPHERIVASLVLDGLESSEDVRDQTISYCVAWHSCLLAGLSPQAIFFSVATAMLEPIAGQLKEFAARTAADQAMEAFGLVKRSTVDGEVEIHVDWYRPQ